ncbi:N-acyl-phosphatidylethanolamine-hydrolyzing phospholipase D family protein [Toxoplasma gondii RUB]|uniref:N-acyl-phosphatidylethanolamine-hydrolyzing phospholipase D family protein n=1 Tax=Toxoplasma gondii RUB TaxID=935652 RepID=A0A086LQ65_TOXGO|nr:N-acyl-phosphatidylethanolamine-hydrolyzing phospholipase D family protein [Toxoplasma gondii RUB]
MRNTSSSSAPRGNAETPASRRDEAVARELCSFPHGGEMEQGGAMCERRAAAERTNACESVSRVSSSPAVSATDTSNDGDRREGSALSDCASPRDRRNDTEPRSAEAPESLEVSGDASRTSKTCPRRESDPASATTVAHRELSLEKSSVRFFVCLFVAMVFCVFVCLCLLHDKPNNPLVLLTRAAPLDEGSATWTSQALASVFSIFVSLGVSPSVFPLSLFSYPREFDRFPHIHRKTHDVSSPLSSSPLSSSPFSSSSLSPPESSSVSPLSADEVDAAVGVDGAFLDSLSPWEMRAFLLADGWSETPNQRTTPLLMPAVLPRLPRAGGGEHLRRHHHSVDSAASPSLPVTAETVLESGRHLLTANVYEEARSVLDQAVREGHLTRAVRMHGQFLYPWKMFSAAEREVLRLTADQVRWFPKWVKNHRHSQRVEKSVLDAFLPVLRPQFADKYGGPGSPDEGRSRGIRYTWLGHATGLVNVDGLKILIDPMFDGDLIGPYSEWLRSVMKYISALCGSLGERHRRPPCEYDELPTDVDVVLLSHNHPDHIMEHDAHSICSRFAKHFRRSIWYVPEGVTGFLRQQGCLPSSIFEFSWGESRTLSCHLRHGRRVCSDGVWHKRRAKTETFKFTFTAGVHWSGRSPSKIDHNTSLWGGFAVAGPEHKFFYGGDTAYWRPDFDEYRKIGHILGPFHLAALPIGAYEPNADLRYQHVKPWETVQMFKDVRAEAAVGVHWGTLRLSAEEFFDPMLDLECALLHVSEEDCKKASELQHRYVAAHALLTQLPKEVAAKRNGGEVGAQPTRGGRGRSTRPRRESETSWRTVGSWGEGRPDSSDGGSTEYRRRRRSTSLDDDSRDRTETPRDPDVGSVSAGAKRVAQDQATRVETTPEAFFSESVEVSQEKTPGREPQSPSEAERRKRRRNEFVDFSLSGSKFGSPSSSEFGEGQPMKRQELKQVEAKREEDEDHVTYGISERVARAGGLPPLPEQAKLVAEVLHKLENLMIPQAHPYRHASNIQRLLRSLKLQDAGLLADDDAWKEFLLTEGARFQTVFLGQSIQVEAAGGDFVRMTRSSGLEHVWPEAPEEHYTFPTKYFDGERGQRLPPREDGAGVFSSLPAWRESQSPESDFSSASSDDPGLFI